jgi:uncharacterized membrane protein YeaQ/YmgE (transglycosylase-associated protein family)
MNLEPLATNAAVATNNARSRHVRWWSRMLYIAFALTLPLTVAGLRAAETAGEKAGAVKEDVNRATERAREGVSRTVSETTRLLEEENPFKLSRNDLVAWIITGAAASYIASLLLGARSPSARFALGLLAGFLGAYFGKVIVAAFQIQFNLGEIILRYETVFLSVIVAAVLVLASRVSSALWHGRRRGAGAR